MTKPIAKVVTDDYTANTATKGAVVVGSSSSGALETGNDRDWFKVTLQAGITYRLQATGGTSTSDLYDPVLYLRNSFGTLLTYNDDASNVTLNSQINYTPTTSGTYYLDVGSYYSNDIGNYRVSVSTNGSAKTDDYSASTATTGVVAVGGTSSGNIERSGDHDWFKVTLKAGTTYQLQATTTGTTGSLADPVLYLRNSAGTSLAYNDDANSSTANASITYTATKTGTYYLDVAGFASIQTGSYGVSATAIATDDYSATTSTTGTVTVGGISSGRIEVGGDHDWFKVTLTAGKTYQLQATTTGSSGSLTDPALYLRSSTGAQLAYNEDANASTADALINFTATTTGTYYLDVTGATASQIGTYGVSVTEATTTTSGNSNFDIEIQYSGNSAYKTYFDQAANVLEKVIVGDVRDTNGIDDILIAASVTSIDGIGNVLGEAGPTGIRSTATGGLPYSGEMAFDSADVTGLISSGTFLDVVVHEMLHVLGFGTLWDSFNLVNASGQYIGENAVAAYRSLTGNNAATYVPLETGGGAGTAYSHWSENIFNTEIMTGYAESSGNMPLSILTVAALEDLGYSVDYTAAEAYALSTASIVTTGIQTTESFDGTTATLMAA